MDNTIQLSNNQKRQILHDFSTRDNMEQYGNPNTFNIESVLIQNIKECHYFAEKAMDCDVVHDVIVEIYET